MGDFSIRARNISKKYRLYEKPQDRMKEALHPLRKRFHREFWALRDVSFEVERGGSLGIIGKNGSGKSTLLQLICGVLNPTGGEITVNGNVSALLELGAGFNQEFTGLQNVYLNGAIKGFTKAQMDERMDAILGFADIGEFIDQPVKTYSSGMYVRLAFSAAINIDPDILIVDEALSVGDMFFQAKCMTRIKKMLDGGVTLLFVSHSLGSVKSLCAKSILLNNGNMLAHGKSDEVAEQFFALRVAEVQEVVTPVDGPEVTATANEQQTQRADLKIAGFYNNAEFQKRASFERVQNGKANFTNIQLLDESGREIKSVGYGQSVVLRMCIEAMEDIHLLGCGYHIKDMNGTSIINTNLAFEDKTIKFVNKDENYVIDWKFKVTLMAGLYNITCVLSIPIDIEIGAVDFCDYVPCALQFEMEVRKGAPLYGYVHWDNDVKISKLERLVE